MVDFFVTSCYVFPLSIPIAPADALWVQISKGTLFDNNIDYKRKDIEMAVIKCKMCGGDLELTEGMTVAECEYCGTKQTVPNADNEKKLTMFSRANRLRLANEFDKAAGVYENIIAEFNQEAEAYWGLVLCKCGIEYVDDPASGKKVPTCHRSSFNSVLEDSDFEQACENADVIARRMYRDEAKTIEEIRKGIIEVSGKEAPYDIFICYKETDENGNRTIDSVLAQEVYDALAEKGYRVFFSRITLEDKLGTEYEPYIFAALNSSKVMLVFGTDYENYNAVWVKNEWSRFLKLMAQDKTRYLIPCYKGIDAYDMPKEFAKFQAQDMGKVGAVQDLLRGIEKLLPSKKMRDSGTNDDNNDSKKDYYAETEKYLKRGQLHLEDGEWEEAYDCFQEAGRNPGSDYRAIMARVGCICAELEIYQIEEFVEDTQILSESISREQALCLAKLKAGHRCLEEGEWELADEYFDEAIKEEPECAVAYIGKLCAEMGCRNESELSAGETPLSDNKYYKRAIRFADNEYRLKLENYNRRRLENAAEKERAFERERQRLEIATERNRQRLAEIRKAKNNPKAYIVGSSSCVMGLRKDGTVLVAGELNSKSKELIRQWHDIIAISKRGYHYTGLKADGSVVSVGMNNYGQCNTNDWKDIIEISSGSDHTVGLKKDGTVISVGSNKYGQCETQGWSDIVSISAGDVHTLGLKSDGTVVAVGHNRYGQCNLDGVKDAIMVSAGSYNTVILKADGTVAAFGENDWGQCDVEDWKGIRMVAAAQNFTAGLTDDGRIVTTCYLKDMGYVKERDISDWHQNILAVFPGYRYILGLNPDGTVRRAGEIESDLTVIDNWQGIGAVEDDELRIQASKKREQEIKQGIIWKKQGLCRYCGGGLGGLFTRRCRRCGEIDE